MSEVAFPPQQRLASPVETVAVLVVMLLFMLLVLLIGVASNVTSSELTMLALALLTIFICLVPLIASRSRPVLERHILLSLWSAGAAVYFGVPVFTQYFLISEPVEGVVRTSNIAPADLVAGQTLVLIALASMYAGYFQPVSRVAAQFVPRPKFDWTHNAALMVALVMIPMGWFVTVGGQFGLIPARLGSGALGAVATASYMGLGLLAIIVIRYRSRPAAMLILLLLVPTMVFAFFTGSKRAVLSPIACVGLGYLVCVRRIQLRWIVAGALLLITLYPTAQFYRQFVLAGNTLNLADVVTNPGRVLGLMSAFAGSVDPGDYIRVGIEASTARLDALGILSVIVRDTPTKVPFQEGWTLSYVALSFIPRVIWPGKPSMAVGQWVTDNYASPDGFIQSSTGSTWIGEFYFNFGIPGVIVGMLLIGMYFRVLHEVVFRSTTVPALFAGIVVLWSTCTTIEMNLIAPVNGVMFTAAPIVLAHVMVRTFSRPAAPPFQEGHASNALNEANAPGPP